MLAISHVGGSATFLIEAVLTPNRPSYAAPASTEQHCYVTGQLTLSGSALTTSLGGALPSTGADGTTDLADIDAFAGQRWIGVGMRSPSLLCSHEAATPVRVPMSSSEVVATNEMIHERGSLDRIWRGQRFQGPN